MDYEAIEQWVTAQPLNASLVLTAIVILSYVLARFVIARGIIYITTRTQSRIDDILVRHIRPVRLAFLAPLIVLYYAVGPFQENYSIVRTFVLFLVLWLSVVTVNATLDASNEIYETSPNFKGVSIQGYLDIVKILLVFVGVILSVSLFTGKSPVVYLTGLGAITAVLLLVFQATILSVVASVQISTNDLVKEGDWIEVPSYGADGDVINMNLHNIKVQNWDKTITVIPTYKMVEVAYKNWRGMTESGGRRIKRSITIDMGSIKFCELDELKELQKIDLISEYLENRLGSVQDYYNLHAAEIDSPLDGPQVTNVEIFRAYIAAYIRSRDDIHQEGLTFLIRSLAPARDGLPIEVYAFTKTTAWAEYEAIQAEIFDHLLAAVHAFDLRVFQEPTGMDFSAVFKN